MLKYVAEKKHLQSMMTLMKSESPAIRLESFHIFKIFVANPKKSRDVHVILYRNKEKLIAFLGGFLSGKTESDEAFKTELERVTKYIEDLAAPPTEEQNVEETEKEDPGSNTEEELVKEEVAHGSADDESKEAKKD